mgnify:FL=1
MLDKIKALLLKIWEKIKDLLAKGREFFNRKFPKRKPKYFDGDLHEAKYVLLMLVYAFFI